MRRCTAELSCPTNPHIIHPDAVYRLNQLQAALGLRPSSLKREIRLGRLRVSKRAGRYYVLAAWVRQWLEAGEVQKTPVRQEVARAD